LAEVRFPYPEFRRGQRELAEAVEEAVRGGMLLVVSAPTGFGKTAAVIYGLLRAGAERVLYVVRTVNEIDPVVRELRRFGASFTFLFSARRMCPLLSEPGGWAPPVQDFWAACRLARARGACPFYEELRERGPGEVARLVREAPSFSAYRLAWEAAERLRVCPFFALRALVEDSVFVVATYPYLFKRDIFEAFLEPLSYEDLVVVVDEAHSLLTAHTMMEERVSERDLRAAAAEVERYAPEAREVSEGLRRLADWASTLRPRRITLVEKGEALKRLGDPELLLDAAEEVRYRVLEEALASGGAGGLRRVRTSVSRVASWLQVLLMEDSSLFAEPQEAGEGRVWLLATPLEPAVVAREPLERCRAAILMSGTIPPGDFAGEVLGVERERGFIDVRLAYGVREHGGAYTVVAADVTTEYRRRGPAMYSAIAERVAIIASTMPGVKLAVYPSYEVMEAVVSRLPLDMELVVEERGTSMEEVEAKVLEVEGEALVNAVAGGKLVEGVEIVDYEGRNLVRAVIVVGVPFPQPDDYTRRHLEVLASRLGPQRARELVYLVQTAVKVRQALGRAVRGPDDRAAFFLLDYRYLRPDIKRLLGLRYNAVVRGVEGLRAQAEKARAFILAGAESRGGQT
jgi:DNA excision repair protein ERCC-2